MSNKEEIKIQALEKENEYIKGNIKKLENQVRCLKDELNSIRESKRYKLMLKIEKLFWWKR